MPVRTWEPLPVGDDSELDALIDERVRAEDGVIGILQAVQGLRRYLSEDALARISARTGVPVSKLVGVATFYSQFRLEPVGKHVIRICHGTACHVAGTGLIQQAVEDELGVGDGETTDDRFFTLNRVSCLGCCSLAPALMIDHDVYARMTPDKARRLLRRLRRAAAPPTPGRRKLGRIRPLREPEEKESQP